MEGEEAALHTDNDIAPLPQLTLWHRCISPEVAALGLGTAPPDVVKTRGATLPCFTYWILSPHAPVFSFSLGVLAGQLSVTGGSSLMSSFLCIVHVNYLAAVDDKAALQGLSREDMAGWLGNRGLMMHIPS
ncbi:hypothetical protein E2C01_076018 [Portunus trituberculatus]|uniref:Uncharacterized protein n=1 Tax=Portunus trituberculatus TaxID=210409 RepID=A0A5B7IGE8_PORTR|nr:hypothetical protein [Portunus trituberculatus]